MRKVFGWLKNHFQTNFDESWGHLYRVATGRAEKRSAWSKETLTPQERKAYNDARLALADGRPEDAAQILISEALRKIQLKLAFNRSANPVPSAPGISFAPPAQGLSGKPGHIEIPVTGSSYINYPMPNRFSLKNIFSYILTPEVRHFPQVDEQRLQANPMTEAIRQQAEQKGLRAEFSVVPASVPQEGVFPRKGHDFAKIVLNLSSV